MFLGCARVACLPLFQLRKATIEEDLQKGEKLMIFDGNDGVKFEERVKVEESREGKSCYDDVDSSRLRRR